MPELRKDYILKKYVIIASDRAKRPHQFKHDDSKKKVTKSDIKKCFFCPGNESLTPPEIDRIEENGNWVMRIFPNKFSAVGNSGNHHIKTDNVFFTYSQAVGAHEVIAETNAHEEQLWDMTPERIAKLFSLYVKRIRELKNKDGVLYVSVFKNHGALAGASLEHSHSQIIAYNLYPEKIREKEKAVERFWDGCPYCKIIDIEKTSDRRIFENDSAVSFTPYASEFAFEAIVFPKRHVISITHLNEHELYCMAQAVHKIITRLKVLGASYNMSVQEGIDDMHFHISIMPRFDGAKRAGFEYSTDTIINSMPPEKAAEFYRSDGPLENDS